MRRRLIFSLVGVFAVAVGGFLANLVAGNHPSLGLDLQGGASVTLEPVGTYDAGALDIAVEIIRKRVDSIGVAEPEITRQGDTVVVSLPGVKDQKSALELVGSSGEVLLRPVLQVGTAETTTTGAPGATSTTVSSSSTLAPSGGPGKSRVAAETSTTVPTTSTTQPVTSTTVDNRDTQALLPGEKDGLLYIVGPAGATGEIFKNDAAVQINNGERVVVVGLRDGTDGTDKWNALATACYNADSSCPTKQLAIVLDGKVVSAPVVQSPTFDNGQVQISGSFTQSEASKLAKYLQFGAVPVKFDIPTVQTVSASLGKDSLSAAILSGALGVLLVLIFLLFYYRAIALVVVGGLGVSGLLLWSVISFISKTNGLALTLSGAAGIIVSIGVTVDSYVVFFERLKDDVQSGKSLRNSAQRGFTSAWRTILAADTVSLLGALVLWWLTVGSVRGFAFFLGLSTLSDIVVSYFYTRPMVLLLARTKFLNSTRILGVRHATEGGVD